MFPVDTAVKVCGSASLKDSEYKVVHFTGVMFHLRVGRFTLS